MRRLLQTVLNAAAARVIFNRKRSAHISLTCSIAVMTYKVMHGTAPRYPWPPTRVTDVPGRRQPAAAEH